MGPDPKTELPMLKFFRQHMLVDKDTKNHGELLEFVGVACAAPRDKMCLLWNSVLESEDLKSFLSRVVELGIAVRTSDAAESAAATTATVAAASATVAAEAAGTVEDGHEDDADDDAPLVTSKDQNAARQQNPPSVLS